MSVSTTAQPPETRRFTVSEYHRMAEAGILDEDDPVELIDGQIYVMSPIGSQHAACVDRLTRLFILAFHDRASVRTQNPILLAPNSEPEPDVALLAPRDDAYAARHPRPDEVMLIVEVSGSSLEFDQTTKLPLYAQAGIPEVWIAALDEDRLHVYRQPSASGYAEHATRERGDTLTVHALPDAGPFTVEDVLGT
jgi:Uma2 family endonuclease